MNYLNNVISLMEASNELGVRVLENGTRLIGHVPHVAPEAWLHVLFAPLTSAHIAQVEHDIATELPNVYSEFLKNTNGLRLFSASLTLDGLRASYVRSGDGAWQPFSITTPNVHERPRSSKASHVFIGGYGCDGSLLYIDKRDLKVFRCTPRSAKPLNDWPSFEVMIEEEAKRLSQLFDKLGRKVDDNLPTTPSRAF